MSAILRSELLKQRTTRTNVGLVLGLVVLILFVILLHALNLPAGDLEHRDGQLMVVGWGTALGTLFAALLGAMSITSEFRYGTIRPTLLATPHRSRVIAAKVCASALAGSALGLLAGTLAASAASVAFAARNIDIQLTAGDYALLIAGGAAAASFWAAIGVGIGALVRDQTATIAGICAWMLLVEPLLLANLSEQTRYAPAAAAGALAGATAPMHLNNLFNPAIGALLLAVYATAIAAAGSSVMARRDIT